MDKITQCSAIMELAARKICLLFNTLASSMELIWFADVSIVSNEKLQRCAILHKVTNNFRKKLGIYVRNVVNHKEMP